MKRKGIDSAEDVSVLLEQALYDAYFYIRDGNVPVRLYWRPDFDIISLVEDYEEEPFDPHARFYREIGASEPTRFDKITWPLLKAYTDEGTGHDLEGLQPFEWVKRETMILAPSLFTGFFAKQTCSVQASSFHRWQTAVKERELAIAHRDEVQIRYERQVAVLLEEPLRRAYRLIRERAAEYACLFWNTDRIDVMGLWGVEGTGDFGLGGVKPYTIYIVQILDKTLSEEAWVESTIEHAAGVALANFFQRRECYVPAHRWEQAARNAEIAERVSVCAVEERLVMEDRREQSLN